MAIQAYYYSTHDDSNCENSVHACAAANTAVVVKSAQYDSSNSSGYKTSSGVKAQKTEQMKDVQVAVVTARRDFRLCVKNTSIETNISHKSRDSHLARDWSVHISNKAAVKCLCCTHNFKM